ncbi:MAG: ECF transporter S component [Lachnospiraceae bacterium]|nr:ECF transporter S component [Lachnospiraceae bacterium]
MKVNVKLIVRGALYTAVFVILSIYGTINLQNLKITVQNFPIYVAAITLGAIPGALVGFTGMFVNQLLTYGFTATTLFWVLPQTILGAVCGYIFEKNLVKINDTQKFFVCILVLQLMVTILNTLIYALDAFIYGYFNYLIIFGPIVIKIMISILTGIVFSILLPIVVKIAKKIH